MFIDFVSFQLTLCHFHSRSCTDPIDLGLRKSQQRCHHISCCTEDFRLVPAHLHSEASYRNLLPVSNARKSELGQLTALVSILNTRQCVSKPLADRLTLFNSH